MNDPPIQKVLTPAQATIRGYIPLTDPYHPQTEDWQLLAVIKDCQTAGVAYVLVRQRCRHKVGDWIGIAVWRRTFK